MIIFKRLVQRGNFYKSYDAKMLRQIHTYSTRLSSLRQMVLLSKIGVYLT